MQRALALYDTTVGKKLVMAASGLALFGFVLAHMAGNLKIFFGAEKFDHYAEFLREIGAGAFGHGGVLWIARLVLLAALAAHGVAAAALWRRARAARRVDYHRAQDLSFSYASRTMRWGGVILLAFVIYHLLHLTAGIVHPDFVRESPYHNVVAAFRVWWVAIPYAVAVVALGLHLYHGLWSSTQTLGLRYPLVQRWRRPLAAAVSAAIVVGYLSVPTAVLAGWVR